VHVEDTKTVGEEVNSLIEEVQLFYGKKSLTILTLSKKGGKNETG
jgi:hypothetical protein